VLPEDSVILLVDADCVGDGAGVAELVGDDGVEVGDVAETVAAELQAVGHLPDEVFTGVEVVLPVANWRGIRVGHHHLCYRGTEDDRA
jgi:hypothetical protein